MFICEYFVYFIIYSFLGWIYESIYCTLHENQWENRGFLYGPCIPMYGIGALIAHIVLYALPFDVLTNASYPMIFAGTAIGSFIMEYTTSYILEKKFHARWWDYSDLPLNINGRVCLIFTMCFGFAGIIITQYVIPPIIGIVSIIPSVIIELLALIFMFIFGMDMALTVSALTNFSNEFERINDEINNQIAAKYDILQNSFEDAKIARIEKVTERREANFVRKELRAEKIAEFKEQINPGEMISDIKEKITPDRLIEIKEQLSNEYVQRWIKNASETERGQFRHIAKFTHPVSSTKSLLEKGSHYLRRRNEK